MLFNQVSTKAREDQRIILTSHYAATQARAAWERWQA
jgi:hypothetical protein